MKNLLLPNYFKYIGYLLLLLAIAFTVGYTWFDFRLMIPVFAVYSSFIETKMFVSFRTNFADELIMILFLTAFIFLVFASEKDEKREYYFIRFRSLVLAVISNAVMLLFSIIFIYGAGFFSILIFNMISLYLFYLLFFYILKKRNQLNH